MAVYCTRADLVNRASQDAVGLRLKDDPTDAAAQAALTAVIDDASAEIDLYLDARYNAAVYASNRWVKYATVTVAVQFLCERRLEAAPGAAKARFGRVMKQLEEVRKGQLQVPGLPQRKQAAPVLSQPRVVLWPYPRVVTQRGQGTGRPQGYPPHDDPLEPPQLP